MVISGHNVLLIEAKLESGERGEQKKIQENIKELLPEFIPFFKESEIRNISIGISPKFGISWKEIIEIIKKSEIDKFTKDCFSQLQRFYQ